LRAPATMKIKGSGVIRRPFDFCSAHRVHTRNSQKDSNKLSGRN